MSKAFEEACIALQVYAGDEKGREIIATRIIDLARGGLINPSATRFQAPVAALSKPSNWLPEMGGKTHSTLRS
jgi:hypothetical protein